MTTVYLDHQIYSYIKNKGNLDKFKGEAGIQKIETVNKLFSLLTREKNNLLIFYSHAHMLDLSSDKSGNQERLIEDLKLRAEFCNDNYLVFNEKENITNYQLAYPEEKFEPYWEDENELDFSNLFDISSFEDSMDSEEFLKLKTQKELLENLKFPSLDDLVSDDVKSNEDFQKMKDILGFMNGGNLKDLVEGFTSFSKKFQEEKGYYKKLRNVVTSGIEKAKDIEQIDDTKVTKFIKELSSLNLSSNDIEKDKFVRANLLEYVKEQWQQRNKEKEPTKFDLHYQSYLMLDMWGIEKEKAIIARNMLHDAQHSFYAGHCEIVVSDDSHFRAKSKLLYKLFDISTQVYSMEEFINLTYSFELEKLNSLSDFMFRLKNDLKTGLVLKTQEGNSGVTEFQTSMKYLNYFNRILLIKEGGKEYVVFRHNYKTYLNTLPYKIVQEITNKVVDLLGISSNTLGHFNWEIECNVIQNGNWTGRTWIFGDTELSIQLSPKDGKLQLVIG